MAELTEQPQEEMEWPEDPDALVRVMMRLQLPDDWEDPPFPEDLEQDDERADDS